MAWWEQTREEYEAEKKYEDEHCQVCYIDGKKCVDPHKQNLTDCDGCYVSFYGRDVD